jgi:branched-chain amino acid aminotransferase
MPQHVWVDGRILPADAPAISVFDRGFLLGDGIFETLRARRGVVVELDAHLERLRESAVPLGIPLPPEDAPIVEGIAALLVAEGLADDGSSGRAPGDAALRITVTRGAYVARGLAPTGPSSGPSIVIAAWPHTGPAAAVLRDGLSLVTSSVRRDPGSPLAGVKTTSRAESVYARLEAERAGADDALILDTTGHVSEATSANVFAIRRGRLLTPPLGSGCLAGTTRAWLLEHAPAHDLVPEEEQLTRADLLHADEVLLSSSVAGVLPVGRLDGDAIGRGGAGPITIQLRNQREAWIDRVSRAAP